MSTTTPPDPTSPVDTIPEETSSIRDRGWYAENSWIVTPLIVFVIIGLICIAIHTYRVRRLRRRVQVVRDEAREWPAQHRHPNYDPERAEGPFTRGNRTLLYIYNTRRNGGGRAPSPIRRPARAATRAEPPVEGLNELGEAPPPYETKKATGDGGANAPGVRGEPPAYGEEGSASATRRES